jgi:transcriptional regulator with XRE-family HTH domain
MVICRRKPTGAHKMKQSPPVWMIIRKLRRDAGLTQQEFADKAGISVQYVRSIEGGYTAISDKVKRKVADALNYSVWALFPDVKAEVNLYNLLVSRHGRDLVIKDREVAMFKEVLCRLTEGQFEDLIASGTSPADVHRLIREWARDFNIEAVR